MQWDVFISHASEDKEAVVRPLARLLQDQGLRVWVDEFELTVGDSLRQAIERGLAESRFGVVVVSSRFLEKNWTQAELDGLVAREIGNTKVILPVWHQIDAATIARRSPMLAGRLAVATERGLEHVASELLRAIRRDASGARTSDTTSVPVTSEPRAAEYLTRLTQQADARHRARIEQIASGQTPVRTLGGPALVLHLMPMNASEGGVAGAFDELAREPALFRPIKGEVRDSRIDYDGLLTGSNGRGLADEQRAYVHVSREGLVEAVCCGLSDGKGYEWIELPHLQALVIRHVSDYIGALGRFKFEPPFAVSVSLLNARGIHLLQDFRGNAFAEDLPSQVLNGDRLSFGTCAVDPIPSDDKAAGCALKPILTHLANAAGLPTSPHFDAKGDYLLNLR